MKHLCMLLLLSVAAPALAKPACTREKDLFSEEEIIEAVVPPVVQIEEKGGARSLFVNFTHHAVVGDELAPGFSLKILLESGAIVDLASDTPTSAAANASSSAVWTNYNVRFPISDADLQTLAAARPTHFQYTMFGEEVTTEPSAAFGKKYMAAFACVAQYLP